jgi:hypothetical protein
MAVGSDDRAEADGCASGSASARAGARPRCPPELSLHSVAQSQN